MSSATAATPAAAKGLLCDYLAAVGRTSLEVAQDAGGMALVLGRMLRSLAPLRLDRSELLRAMRAYGEASLLVVLATALFVGMIMVLQAAVYVQQYGVYDLLGWGTGFATFREVGPLLIGLMFSGRVGANNTSELATMRVTEQLDALRILAIDVYEAIVLPRTLAMVVSLASLVVFGDLMAVVSGAVCGRLLLDVPYGSFLQSLFERVSPADFLVGVEKALAYGLVVAVVSTYYGLSARSGSSGVGRAVNAQVVGCAVGLFLVDYLMTSVVR